MVQAGAVAGLAPVGLARLLEELDELVRSAGLYGQLEGRATVLVFDVDGLLGGVCEQGADDLEHALRLVSPALDGVVRCAVVPAQVMQRRLVGEVERSDGRWIFRTEVSNGAWVAAVSDGRVEDGSAGAVHLRNVFWVGQVDELDDVKGWVEATRVMQGVVVDGNAAIVIIGIGARMDEELGVGIRE